jgi:hypothetical protein
MAWQDILKQIEQEAYGSGGNKSATYDSELARANKVLAERKAAGLDTSGQETYLNQLKTSYNTGAVKGQAYAAGANPNNISPGYVQAVSAGTQQQYTDKLLGTVQKKQTAGTSTTGTGYEAPVYEAPDFTKQVNNIYNPMISSNLANLKAAYDKARSDVNAQIPGIQQDARQARTLNETDYIKSLPDLYRAMEAAGQKGGENITGNIALQTTRGANLGGINQTEMTNLAALQKAIADLNAEQPLKEQSVRQDLQSQQAQALMDAQKYGLDYALKMADLTGNVEVSPGVSMPTLQAQQYQSNKALQEAGLTGLYNGQQTLAAQQQALAAKQQDLDNLYRSQVFDYNVSRDTVADTQWQKTMNLNLRQQSFSEAQASIQNALSQQRISQEDASQALQWAKFNAESDPNSLDNQIKKSQLDLNTYSKSNAVLNDTTQRLDSMYLTKDSITGDMKRNANFSDAQLRSAIIALNLPDDQTDALLSRYGLPINQ